MDHNSLFRSSLETHINQFFYILQKQLLIVGDNFYSRNLSIDIYFGCANVFRFIQCLRICKSPFDALKICFPISYRCFDVYLSFEDLNQPNDFWTKLKISKRHFHFLQSLNELVLCVELSINFLKIIKLHIKLDSFSVC